METLDVNFTNDGGLRITDSMKIFMLETSKWAKFLAILGFVFAGLAVFGAIIAIISGAAFGSNGGPLFLVGFLYLVLAAINFFPLFYLFNFSSKVKEGLLNSNQTMTEAGFENLKSTFKFMGIYTIIVLGLWVLMMIFGVFAGVMMQF